MMENFKPEWRKVYEAGLAKGYEIMMMRDYRDEATSDGRETDVLMKCEFGVRTPYFTADGTRFDGYGTVILKNAHENPLRDTESVEIYDNGRNVEDTREDIFDRSGHLTDKDSVCAELASFIAAASEYPHIMHYEEWCENCLHRNGVLEERATVPFVLDPPDAKGYSVYLGHIAEGFGRNGITYVGPVQTRNDLEELMTEAGYQEGMDDVLTFGDFGE